VSIFKSQINNVHIGIHEYVPILFDEEHCSLVNITFHSLLYGINIFKKWLILPYGFSIDFRFRASPNETNPEIKENNNNNYYFENNFAENSQRNSNIQGKLSKSLILNNNVPPKNFKEFLDKVSCECKPFIMRKSR